MRRSLSIHRRTSWLLLSLGNDEQSRCNPGRAGFQPTCVNTGDGDCCIDGFSVWFCKKPADGPPRGLCRAARHRRRTGAPVPPHPRQHPASSAFWAVAIRLLVWWRLKAVFDYTRMVLNYTSLMTSAVEQLFI